MQEFDKQFYKIKDVAEILGVNQSTLRYWESVFPECAPHRSPNNIRYYRPQDIETLQIIYYLVKTKGLKIEAAKEQMRVNRTNISRRMEVINRLQTVRNDLADLQKALTRRKL